ncbi:serine/threonine-protein kinase [Georgenia sp. Z1491]|uniref:serine/threonine-protein kinase n=1 Tax=Georgenia sp. Z1491 TaxID=3416707 RepID=UPI003CE947D7
MTTPRGHPPSPGPDDVARTGALPGAQASRPPGTPPEEPAGRLAAGDLVVGRYELTVHLNTGGSGEVWVARDQRLGRQVAIKCLHPDLAAQPHFLERFRKESQNTARLRHVNIAALLDHGRADDGGAYLTHELVVGDDLADLLTREGTLPPTTLIRILVQVLDGLQAAHAAGVVHRDVKPANVLVSARGTVKITDFGISRAVGQETMTSAGMVMGTPEYLAPELARGATAGPAADLYAVGVIAVEALTGERPFGGARPLDVLLAHVNDPVPEVSGAPPELAAVVRDLLAKDPAGRPASASAAADRLRDALESIRRPRRPGGDPVGRVDGTAPAAGDRAETAKEDGRE